VRMKKRLFTGLVVALAGTMIWANLSWGQGQGQGPGGGGCCAGGAGSPGVCQVQGQGAPNCPNPQGNPNRAQRRGQKARDLQGQGGAEQKAPSPPANPPQEAK